MAMTFQEAFDQERRARCEHCKAGLVVITICGERGHKIAETETLITRVLCSGPSREEFEEQVWSRLQAAEARAMEAANELHELKETDPVDYAIRLRADLWSALEREQQAVARIAELEAERDRLLSPYCEHCRSLLLPTINCCPLCAQLQERIGTSLAGAAETERKLEADVERLRVEVEAARECKERRCPYGLWRKAIADTQGQGQGEKES